MQLLWKVSSLVEFLINVSIIWIYVMSFVSPVRYLAWPKLYHAQTFQPDMFIPVMLIVISNIEFYHVILLSVTLTMAGGHKVSAKQNLLASFSCLSLFFF